MKTAPIIIAFICFLAVIDGFAFTEDEDFAKELKAIRQCMAKGRWSRAEKQLNNLLGEHAGQDYAVAKRAEIEECIKTCVFWKSFKPPKPKEVVSGKLVSYKSSSGAIKLQYAWDQISDFDKQRMNVKGGSGDAYFAYILPAIFTGPYTIEMEGTRYPNREQEIRPNIIVCNSGNKSYQIDFGLAPDATGAYYMARISRFDGKEYKDIETCEASLPMENNPFKIKIKVSGSKITAYMGKKKMMEVRKEKTLFGSFFFRGFVFDKLLIQGNVQPAWIQGKIDSRAQAAKRDFELTYSPEDHLPPWLLAKAPDQKKTDTEEKDRYYPGPVVDGQEKVISTAIEHYNGREFREGLKYVLNLSETDITNIAKSYCATLFLQALERYDEALEKCEEVCRSDPQFMHTRLIEASLNVSLGKREEAERVYNKIRSEFPGREESYVQQAGYHLRAGSPQKAKTVLENAISNNIASSEINRLNQELSYALNGPSWNKVYDAKSAHYQVFSDIDLAICFEASKILEEAYATYSANLEKVRGEKKRFRVYLFSGEAGYNSYKKSFGVKSTMASAGVYIPTLKQLLIWNLPDRDSMLKTIRHEGFHQYLDSLTTVTPPVWFNEGLAEYYEQAEKKKGRWLLDTVNTYHLRILTSQEIKIMPLKDFIYLSYNDFYKNASLCYAQSWAFIHFLRHSTPTNRKMFNSLFELFQRNLPVRATLEDIFNKIDLDKLEADFKDHLKRLS